MKILFYMNISYVVLNRCDIQMFLPCARCYQPNTLVNLRSRNCNNLNTYTCVVCLYLLIPSQHLHKIIIANNNYVCDVKERNRLLCDLRLNWCVKRLPYQRIKILTLHHFLFIYGNWGYLCEHSHYCYCLLSISMLARISVWKAFIKAFLLLLFN